MSERDDFLWEAIQREQTLSPRAIDPPAELIVNLTRSLHDSFANNDPRKVFLLHFPRGATPIVEGIKYAWKKLYGRTKMPFRTIFVPVSRVNLQNSMFSTNRSKVQEILERSFAEIPEGSTVIYLDEAVSGQTPRKNIEDIYAALRGRNFNFVIHLFTGRSGRDLDERNVRKLRQFVRHKNQHNSLGRRAKVNLEIHRVPEVLPWTDNTAYLGQNWGLKHKFPFDLLLKACGGTKAAATDIEKVRTTFEELYGNALSLSTKFRVLKFPSRDFKRLYLIRDRAARAAFIQAITETGFSKKYAVSPGKRSVIVNGHEIKFVRLKDHLFGNHPQHEIERGRHEYVHHLAPDERVLIDFSHSGEGGHFRLMHPEQVGSYRFMHVLKKAIGAQVHNIKHPPRRR